MPACRPASGASSAATRPAADRVPVLGVAPVAGQESGLLGAEPGHGLTGALVPVLVAGLAGAPVADFQLAVGVQGQVRDCPAVEGEEHARRENRWPLVDGAGQRLAQTVPAETSAAHLSLDGRSNPYSGIP